MGRAVIIYGKSGSGKSRSLKNFAEDEILLINPAGKDLPFRAKKFKYTKISDNVDLICGKLTKMPCKVAVIDDATFIMVNKFMREHGQKSVNQFDMYNMIADSMFKLFNCIQSIDDDKIVYIILHEEKSENYGNVKLKTIGKLLDDKCPMEARVTICLRCMSDGEKHWFRTNTDGMDITKSPEDMFELEIENDLKFVDDTIREYYGFKEEKPKKTEEKAKE